MKTFLEWLKGEGFVSSDDLDDYRGMHQAPNRHNGSPLYNVSLETYPDDFYSDKAVRYYGDGSPLDFSSVAIIHSVHNKPNASVKIYRAVPKVITTQEKIDDLEKQKAYIMKYGRVPAHVEGSHNKSQYYELISNELDNLKKQPTVEEKKITINPGDWVTINRNYAVQHGQSTLNGQYRVLTKTVKAKDLFTDGNSVHEFGYDPS